MAYPFARGGLLKKQSISRIRRLFSSQKNATFDNTSLNILLLQ